MPFFFLKTLYTVNSQRWYYVSFDTWFFFSYFFLRFVSASIIHLDIIVLISERVSSSFVNSVLSHTLSFRNVICSFTLSHSRSLSLSLSLDSYAGHRAREYTVYAGLRSITKKKEKPRAKLKKKKKKRRRRRNKIEPVRATLIVGEQVCEFS